MYKRQVVYRDWEVNAMGKFGFNELLNTKSKTSGTVSVEDFKEIWLSPYEVKPSESNFYSQENIEELADSFLAVGRCV